MIVASPSMVRTEVPQPARVGAGNTARRRSARHAPHSPRRSPLLRAGELHSSRARPAKAASIGCASTSTLAPLSVASWGQIVSLAEALRIINEQLPTKRHADTTGQLTRTTDSFVVCCCPRLCPAVSRVVALGCCSSGRRRLFPSRTPLPRHHAITSPLAAAPGTSLPR